MESEIKGCSLPVMQEKAVLHFGLTDNPLEAGYILSDGRLLKIDGEHRLIGRAFPPETRRFARPLFLQTGAIRLRIREEGTGRSLVEFSKVPTPEQKQTLIKILNNEQNVDLEFTIIGRVQHDGQGILFTNCPTFSKTELEKLIARASRLQTQR